MIVMQLVISLGYQIHFPGYRGGKLPIKQDREGGSRSHCQGNVPRGQGQKVGRRLEELLNPASVEIPNQHICIRSADKA